jgi:hypothetical protein
MTGVHTKHILAPLRNLILTGYTAASNTWKAATWERSESAKILELYDLLHPAAQGGISPSWRPPNGGGQAL